MRFYIRYVRARFAKFLTLLNCRQCHTFNLYLCVIFPMKLLILDYCPIVLASCHELFKKIFFLCKIIKKLYLTEAEGFLLRGLTLQIAKDVTDNSNSWEGKYYSILFILVLLPLKILFLLITTKPFST